MMGDSRPVGAASWFRSASLLGLVCIMVSLFGCVDVEERRRSTLERAERQMALGDHPRALQILSSFLTYDPRDLEIHTRMAEIHLDSGTSATALHILESIPGDVDLDARATRLLARALVVQGNLKRAISVVEILHARGEPVDDLLDDLLRRLAVKGVPRRTDLPDPWKQRVVEMQLERKRFEAAAETLRSVPAGERRHQLLEQLIREAWIADEVEVLGKIPALDQEPESAWKLLAKHRVLSATDRLDEAASVEKRFLARYPNHAHRYDMLLSSARRQIRSGALEQGLKSAQSAAGLRPSEPAALMEQALALEALGRTDEAERTLEVVLSTWPSHSGALRLLSRLDRRRGGGGASEAAHIRLSIDTEGGS